MTTQLDRVTAVDCSDEAESVAIESRHTLDEYTDLKMTWISHG